MDESREGCGGVALVESLRGQETAGGPHKGPIPRGNSLSPARCVLHRRGQGSLRGATWVTGPVSGDNMCSLL